MIRCIGIALALLAGPVLAGEQMDCFNDEVDESPRYTSAQPEVLRVTDADIEDMLRRVREHESRRVVASHEDPSDKVSIAASTPAAD